MTAASAYVGRFAPSPTGPLHLGSLVAAISSYLDAKVNGGQWRLRMDDLDTPRNEPGASDGILRTLERHNLLWDGAVIYQSQRMEAYRHALDTLARAQQTFLCQCSRRMLDADQPYPGTCRHRSATHPSDNAAMRVRSSNTPIAFDDAVEGPQSLEIAATSGDFIVWRRDGLPSYQLATATDDGEPEITHIVRGNDLLADTPRQLYLIDLLKGQRPTYAHLPVLVDEQSVKLSKRTGAAPVDSSQPLQNIAQALGLMGMQLPSHWAQMECSNLLSWASLHWQLPTAQQPNPVLIS